MSMVTIQVPFMNGDPHHPASRGPARLAAEVGLPTVVVASEPEAFAVNRALAARVREVAAGGDTPLVFAGCCEIGMGVLAGLEHGRCGAVWIDAHGDFNTPESSPSGFLPGMALAILVGHCHGEEWSTMGDATPIAEEATLLLGSRDLDPEERARLERSAVRLIEWRDGVPGADPLAAVDALARRVDEVYLHIDLDGLDPTVVPSVRPPHVAPGGVSLEQALAVIDRVHARLRVKAATIAYYAPEFDTGDRTLGSALRLIAAIQNAQ